MPSCSRYAEIATDKDVWQTFRVQELVYRNPTALIDVKAEHSSQRRPLNSGGQSVQALSILSLPTIT